MVFYFLFPPLAFWFWDCVLNFGLGQLPGIWANGPIVKVITRWPLTQFIIWEIKEKLPQPPIGIWQFLIGPNNEMAPVTQEMPFRIVLIHSHTIKIISF